jgi:Putative peptidoglycan binding domain
MRISIDPENRDDVLWLQTALMELMPGPGAVAHIGVLGPLTEKALRLYQLGHGIPLTGKPDEMTLRLIQEELAQRKS